MPGRSRKNGLLHSPKYREAFAADLKKSLPRIPIVEDIDAFLDFSYAGKQLANLHLNYEEIPAYEGVTVIGDRQKEEAPDGRIYMRSRWIINTMR